jgi:hypothetical protein
MSAQTPARQHDFNVRPGSLLQGAQAIATQAGVDVVVQAQLRGRAAAGVNGRLTVDQAFERLLRPTGARAVRLADGVYRIEPAPPVRPTPQPPRPAAPTVLDEVIVTASVRRGGLSEATGRTRIPPTGLERTEGVASSEAVADLSATVDSTRQGPGRNKLFVRGLADSAFNGPLQSTIGQYLGDLRLTYGSPDPDLALVDIAGVEVFEGPQGARFDAPVQAPDLQGAGYSFLGGRLVTTPNGPAALFVYDGTFGDRLTVMVRPMEIDRNRPMSERSYGSLDGVTWSENGLGFSVVAPRASADLLPVAENVRRQTFS